MANRKHLELLRRGVDVWNASRAREEPDLGEIHLVGRDLRLVNLRQADLGRTDLHGADLRGADLRWANLFEAKLDGADLRAANLDGAALLGANLFGADLRGANLRGAHLDRASLRGANLHGADLDGADLRRADLHGANLNGANLREATLLYANLEDAVLTGCYVHGISAWNLQLSEATKQQDLIITPLGEPQVAVDNIEVAQFVYLILRNQKIRDVIDTVGRKGVLLLGRFTEGRIAILERLREELRKRGYLPIVFNFDKPETKTFTETVRVLAGLCRFVIADVTDPQSVPAELQAAVPAAMVPFLPIIKEGEKPFALLEALRAEHSDRVFEPIYYSSLDALIGALDKEIIGPAEARFDELVVRKAETMKGKHV
jgi:uncharacterized protein YjbI with pentapeptide repeats